MDPLRTDAKVNPPSSTMRFAAMGSVGASSKTRKALWNAVRGYFQQGCTLCNHWQSFEWRGIPKAPEW
jgi:hypothetical protein